MDLAVGQKYASDGGRVWMLLLNDDGTVRSQQQISGTQGGLGAAFDPVSFGSLLGASVAPLGDWDGDGVPDLAVGLRGYKNANGD